jgi:LysM repeat protein
VVRSTRGASAPRWRWWWLVPAIGLIPVLFAGLTTQGAFNRVSGGAATQVASGPTATGTASAQTLAAVQPTAQAGGDNAAAADTSDGTSAAPTPAEPASVARTGAGSAAPASSTTTSSAAASSGSLAAATASPTTCATSASSAPHADATSQAFITYHVRPGDTIHFIAQTYGVSAASISQASGLSNPDQLRVGQVLTIPAHPGWLYRVQPCETLDQIAARTGVATDSIVAASGLTAASVGPGDVILIPDQAAAQNK